jgi:hypothetical protein
MKIDEHTYILGYWFASDGNNNWYMMMTKKNGEWVGQQTFRYNISPGDPYMTDDEKSIYTMRLKGETPEQEVIDKINLIFEVIKLKFNDFNDKFLVKGNAEKFMKIASKKHYMHIKQVQ